MERHDFVRRQLSSWTSDPNPNRHAAHNRRASPPQSSLILKNGEQLISLTQAAKLFPRPAQRKPHVAAIRRHCTVGLSGMTLGAVSKDGALWTSKEAVYRFLRATRERSRKT